MIPVIVIQGLVSALVLTLFLGCASSGEATRSSGEKSEVSIDDVFSPQDKVGPTGAVTESAAAPLFSDLPGIDQQSFEDYRAFTAWLRARQPDTPEFYEFQLWREYLEYIRINTLN
ncbi:MAG: hypothetical protein KTR20_14945 [Cellvibrionaceae bacterium]|nr:hypothetical protein [Cellvibrionaceae bacterium]